MLCFFVFFFSKSLTLKFDFFLLFVLDFFKLTSFSLLQDGETPLSNSKVVMVPKNLIEF